MHAPQFVEFVLVRVLDDAQAIDPKELKSEGMRDIDRVANGSGKDGEGNAVGVGRHVECGGLMGLRLAPHITKGEVLAASTICGDQTRALDIRTVDKTCRETRIGGW